MLPFDLPARWGISLEYFLQGNLETSFEQLHFFIFIGQEITLQSVQQGTHYSVIAALREKHFQNEYDIGETYNS